MVEKELKDFRDNFKKEKVVEVRTDVENSGTPQRIYFGEESHLSREKLERLIYNVFNSVQS